MSRRPNALYRLLALLLALSLCPALGLAQEQTELPYALLLTGTDAQAGAGSADIERRGPALDYPA
ncbi:MAG TPA: hypothetical protein PKE04_10255 [Clostridia bacterium]|nr:hypothetical protein [Clostridia bacterium]